MTASDITIQLEQTSTPAYLALPPAGSGPGVLVLHAWWGLNPFFKSVCRRLARAGFVALAPDLYNGKLAATPAEARLLMAQTDFTQAQAAVTGSLAYLGGLPATTGRGLGTLGFSMGAGWALWLSTSLPQEVAAVVVFYGTDQVDPTEARAAYLGHYAEADEFEPAEGVSQLEFTLHSAGLETYFYTYPGTHHWFFESNQPQAYNPRAARLAWRRTLHFLRDKLTNPEFQVK
jgi:carboxymethylenebutenolidase